MTEDEKRKFDAWESIRDHAWREFEDKSRAEWRLSFGIWAALLASTGALIASGHSTAANLIKNVSLCWFAFFALVIVLGHVGFLYWIQRKLQKAREFLFHAHVVMRYLLDGTVVESEDRKIWKQVPMYVESGITILLVIIFYFVLRYSGCGEY